MASYCFWLFLVSELAWGWCGTGYKVYLYPVLGWEWACFLSGPSPAFTLFSTLGWSSESWEPMQRDLTSLKSGLRWTKSQSPHAEPLHCLDSPSCAAWPSLQGTEVWGMGVGTPTGPDPGKTLLKEDVEGLRLDQHSVPPSCCLWPMAGATLPWNQDGCWPGHIHLAGPHLPG